MNSSWQLAAITGGYLCDPYDAFSPDGQYFVIPKLWSHAFAVYDVDDRFSEVARCVGHSGEVTAYKITSDGKRLVSFSPRLEEGASVGRGGQLVDMGDGSVIVWDLLTGKRMLRLDFERLYGCWFSDDGRYVCTASPQGYPIALKVWDVATAEEMTHLRGLLESAKGILTVCPQGKRLVTRSCLIGEGCPTQLKSRIDVWSLPAGEMLLSIPDEPAFFGALPMAAISPDSRLLAYALEREPGVEVWDLEQQRHVTSVYVEREEGGVPGVWFSRDSSRLFVSTLAHETQLVDAAATSCGTLHAYQIQTTDRDACFDPTDNVIIRSETTIRSSRGIVTEHSVEMLDAESMHQRQVLHAPRYLASPHDCPDGALPFGRGVSLSPRGDVLLSRGDLTVNVWTRDTSVVAQ